MRLGPMLAWRFLRDGKTQSLLTLAGATIGMTAFVFVSAIIIGLQANLIDRTLGSQAHLTVTTEEPAPRPLYGDDGTLHARRVQEAEPRQRPFDQWQRALETVERTPGVVAACPKVTGSALAIRGTTQRGVTVVGADAGRLRQIVDLPGYLIEGRYRLGAGEAVLGDDLADELGIAVGDPLRLATEGRDTRVRVVGIFDVGQEAVDGRWVVLSLRGAQTLLDRVGDVTAIDARVDAIFEADVVAERVQRRTGRTVESWIDRNQQLLVALQAQDQSTMMIRLFVMLAVAMGIASVLIVSVVQRRGQIGILRAVGTRRRAVLAIFLWQGLFIGVVSGVLGTVLGSLLTRLMENVAFFEMPVSPSLVAAALAISVGTGVVSAILPARRAARMDPAAAIRGDG
jgi:lipoprotein-releasing system permease protein